MTSSEQQWPLVDQSNAAPQPQPEPDARLGEAERDVAERFLQQAFRDGRIDTADFEERFSTVMRATRTGEVQRAIAGIAAPVSKALVQVNDRFTTSHRGPAAPPVRPDNAMSGFSHFSGLFSWIVGPAICYATARPGSPLRREAAKAFNFQLTAGLSFIGLAIVAGFLGLGGLVAIGWLGWFGLTIFAGVKAAAGEDWRNPVNKVLPINPLPIDGR